MPEDESTKSNVQNEYERVTAAVPDQQTYPDQTEVNTSERALMPTAAARPAVNLLNYKGYFAAPVDFASARLPHQRLALFGGFQGIISHMIADRTIPDLKTFTLLLETIAPDTTEENALMEEMQRLKVC